MHYFRCNALGYPIQSTHIATLNSIVLKNDNIAYIYWSMQLKVSKT